MLCTVILTAGFPIIEFQYKQQLSAVVHCFHLKSDLLTSFFTGYHCPVQIRSLADIDLVF